MQRIENQWSKRTVYSFLVFVSWISGAASAQEPRIVDYLFLGDSNTYAGDYVAMLEIGLRLSSQQSPNCLNLGLPSETVSGLSEPGHAGGNFPRPDLHERLGRILQQVKPKTVFACYGMNCGIYHPYSDERFAAFQQGTRKLAEAVKASGAQLVMITPPLFDELPLKGRTLPFDAERFDRPYKGYDQVLDVYAAWLVAEAAAGKWQVVDVRPKLKKFLTEKRLTDSGFTFAPDGVHLNPQGHWLVARELIRRFAPRSLEADSEEFSKATDGKVDLQPLLDMLRKRQRILTDSYLTAIGHERPGMARGDSPEQAEKRAKEIEQEVEAKLTSLRNELLSDAIPVMVCTDAGAGAYEAFPDICRLADGRLLCVFYAGYGHVALPSDQLPKGGRIAGCYSSDEGKTWSPAVTIFDGPDDDRDPSIVQLKDGRLLCTFFSLKKADQPPGYTGLGSWLIESQDGGKTWSEPRQLSASHYCSSPIRVLNDGRLILGMYVQNNDVSQGSVIFSDDGGRTWQSEVLIDNAGMKLDAETDIIELKDGSLLAAQRPEMASAKSLDRGASWSKSQPMGFAGHCPYFLRTKSGEIVLAYRLPQTSLRFSRDEGASWSENVLVDEVGGAYPSMVNLNDGTVLIVYYEEGQGSNIRARRFQVAEDGLKWLPVGH